ncbi:MAG: hypothetical protein NkDv07_0764 [Candidatus Improbicoccus devescovinae]|nr:MAG: hypothetical protein NkDv07_0764 [Candidatus Improbicoccus devescovinae]
MNIFLKNNKIITCILCFSLLKSPAYAASHFVLAPNSVVEDELLRLQKVYTQSRQNRKRLGKDCLRDLIHHLYRMQEDLDGTNPAARKDISLISGFYFIPQHSWVWVNKSIAKDYLGDSRSFLLQALNELGITEETYDNLPTAIDSTETWLRPLLHTRMCWWSLRRYPDTRLIPQDRRTPLPCPELGKDAAIAPPRRPLSRRACPIGCRAGQR